MGKSRQNLQITILTHIDYVIVDIIVDIFAAIIEGRFACTIFSDNAVNINIVRIIIIVVKRAAICTQNSITLKAFGVGVGVAVLIRAWCQKKKRQALCWRSGERPTLQSPH